MFAKCSFQYLGGQIVMSESVYTYNGNHINVDNIISFTNGSLDDTY